MKTKNLFGKTIWSFQVFRTTRRGGKTKREAQLVYLELEKEHKRKFSAVSKISSYLKIHWTVSLYRSIKNSARFQTFFR